MIANPEFLYAALAFAGLEWLAVWRDWRKVEYVAKPAVMAALLVWLFSYGIPDGALFWFGVGVLMSLLGDILLLLPDDRFIFGLVSFLMAHVAYIIGLNTPLPLVTLPMIGAAVVVGVSAMRLLQRIRTSLEERKLQRLVGPVRLYTNVIALMLLSALLTLFRPEWRSAPAYLVSVGALLFVSSDALLAWIRFVAPVRFGKVAVMVSYHLGQIALVVGGVLQFAG